MFWSGNYIAVRELNSLLKEENVTLSQVLEADDILQECKADNKALMLFLTRADILNELMSLITEEPPQHVELSQQYRHASTACEVLTSHLSMLSDRLSSDTVQMNRLCDFLNREPPLNPLLASYFSKTVEMLLEKSPKQDCYLYHIVCLRVLDFFKSRRDFLPNLLRHISTSAIADVFKYFIRLDDLFNKIVMEWFDEHQVLECLIQIVCGSYSGAEYPDTAPQEKGAGEVAEKEDLNHNQGESAGDDACSRVPSVSVAATAAGVWRARRARVAGDNACALLGDVVGTGCAGDAGPAQPVSRTAAALQARLGSTAGVARLLSAAFSTEGPGRGRAAAHAATLLLQLVTAAGQQERPQLELAVAPHLPLLHHALIHPPPHTQESIFSNNRACVGFARLQIAALIAELTLSSVHEVCTTLLALGTPGVLLELLVQFPDNNFLHSSVVSLVRNALCCNPVYCTQYAEHLFGECDMLNRFMDLYEENENKELGPRRGHAGHVSLVLVAADRAGGRVSPPPGAASRFRTFVDTTLRPLQHMLDTPLGGTHPAESIYEVDCMMDTLAANFDFSDMAASANMEDGGDDLTNENECGVSDSHADSPEFVADGLGLHDDIDDTQMNKAKSNFLELANQRFDDDMWDDTPEPEHEHEHEHEHAADARDVLDDFSPWASGPAPCASAGGEGWAQFEPAPAPAPATTPTTAQDAPFDAPFTPFWGYDDQDKETELSSRLSSLRLGGGPSSLANNLLTAMSGMSPCALATLVHIHRADVAFAPLDAGAGDVGDVGDVDTADVHSAPVAHTDLDTLPQLHQTPEFDQNVNSDRSRPVDTTLTDTHNLENAFEVKTNDTSDKGEPPSRSPDKSSDPWRAKPDVRQSSEDSDDKKSDVVRQSADESDKTNDSQTSSVDKSSSDSPATVVDIGRSDTEPSSVDNTCDSPADGER